LIRRDQDRLQLRNLFGALSGERAKADGWPDPAVARIAEMENRYLRVVLLPDGETVHNAFFDREFKP
jgi:hypothetical protein